MKKFYLETKWGKGLQQLSDAEMGRLFRGLMEYADTEIRPELSGREAGAFLVIADALDAQIQKSSSRSITNRQNVMKRYESYTNSTNRNESLQIVTKENKEKSSPALPPTPPITSSSEEKEEKKERSTLKGTKKERPTLDEIAAYIKERNLNVDAQEFFDYFEVGHWIDSKGQPVRNWKQKLLTWNKMGCGRPKSAGRPGMGANASYKQTQLNDDELDALFVDLDHDLPCWQSVTTEDQPL